MRAARQLPFLHLFHSKIYDGLSILQQGGILSSSYENNLSSKRRAWFIPAVFAVILFIGAVASNLIANYVQPNLEQYRRWVWVAFGLALVVTVIVAIKDYHKPKDFQAQPGSISANSSGAVAIGNNVTGTAIITGSVGRDVVFGESRIQGIGKGTAQGWIEKVIAPLLQALRGVEQLLTQDKVWTWRYQTRDFEMIPAARNLIHPLTKDSLDHFAEHHPDVQMMISLYDQQRAALSVACERLQKALVEGEGLRNLYEHVKADNSVVNGEIISNAFNSYTEMDHLETLAESIVNRRHKESYSYVYRHPWSKYRDEFLDLRRLPDIGAESERVVTAHVKT